MDGGGTATAHGKDQMERFDLDDQRGKLVDTEHRGRYWWAAQIAAGKDVLDVACGTGYGSEILDRAGARSVTGVDISEEAVEAASQRLGERVTVQLGDIRDLPLPDDSFDLAVCWETIEHIEEGERALAELRRVLRPDGVLLVSSPNPRVYPPGNEFHVHEYTPEELAASVSAHFANVASFRQHAWLASTIEPANGNANSGNGSSPLGLEKTAEVKPGGEIYSVIAASDGDVPAMGRLVALGEAFEARWWREQLAETGKVLALSEEHAAEADRKLRETSAALLEANQALARMPALEFRLQEAEGARTVLRGLENSLSWRITAPLRRLRALLRRR